MKVKIQLRGGILPTKATSGAAAYDLYVPEDVTLKLGRQIVDLKFGIELPQGYAATIQPRSGFSSKGIEVEEYFDPFGEGAEVETVRLNGDVLRGLVDCDYRGNVGVILKIEGICHYYSEEDNYVFYSEEYNYVLKKGTRIAQMQIVEVPQVELIEVEELSETDRGEGGFGSTGTK